MRALKVAICGSGMRSRTVWQQQVRDSDGFELVGVQDPAPESLRLALETGGVGQSQVFADLAEMLDRTRPDAVIVVSVNATHAAVAEHALQAGCHVLVEKPLATSLADACRLVHVASSSERLLGVVQNWRTKAVGIALRSAIAKGAIGAPSHVFFRYLRDRELPHLPDYLFEEEDPLLFAMVIHHLDLLRFALDDEFAAVDSHVAHPQWSRYRHPSVMQLWLETERGTAISYAATFSSRNAHLPLESFQVEGELGTLYNESAYSEPPLLLSRRGLETPIDLTDGEQVRDSAGQYQLADRRILENFRAAIESGEPLIASGSDNLGTVAALEAAARSWREGVAVDPRQLLATTIAEVESKVLGSHA